MTAVVACGSVLKRQGAAESKVRGGSAKIGPIKPSRDRRSAERRERGKQEVVKRRKNCFIDRH